MNWFQRASLLAVPLVFSLALACLAPFTASAETGPSIMAIPKSRWPALLYVQEDSNRADLEKSTLMAACFDEGKPVVRPVITSQVIRVDKLGDATFLIQAGVWPKDRTHWTQSCYLVNFETGAHTLLDTSESREKLVHHWCLGSDLDQGKAVVLRYGLGTTENTLIDVDLKTLDTTRRCSYPLDDATTGFHGPRMRISPDFRLLATMVNENCGGWWKISRSSRYSLRVLDLETREIVVLDDAVGVEISGKSSQSEGTPPYDWIDDHRILYQHVVPSPEETGTRRDEADHVLKCVDVRNKSIDEWIRKPFYLTSDGGFMERDWFTGTLRYQDFIVDTERRVLTPWAIPSALAQEVDGKTMSFGAPGVHKRERPIFPFVSVSASEEHVAFLNWPGVEGVAPGLLAKTAAMARPVRVAEGSSCTPMDWIEDTTSLRTKQAK